MPITLGILAQSRQAVAASDFVLLDQRVLGSPESSVIFSNLNSTYGTTYKHLQLRVVTQGPSSLALQFNGVTSAGSYRDHRLFGFNGAVSSDTIFTDRIYLGASSDQSGNLFSSKVIDILDPFVTTKNKTVRTMSGRTEQTPFIIEFISGLFISTAAVTSINIFGSTNMSIGSRISLYGVKG